MNTTSTPVLPSEPGPSADPAVPDEVGAPAAPRTSPWRTDLGRGTAYLLSALPLALVSFTLLVTGVSLAAGLLVTVVGIPVAAGTLGLAVAFGRLERRRLTWLGRRLAPLHIAPVLRPGLGGVLLRLRDPRRWTAVLHGVGVLVLSAVTWSLAVTWWATALAGLTYWAWMRWLPPASDEDDVTLPELLDLPVHEAVLYLVIGLVFAATLLPLLRGCIALHTGWARLLLTGDSRRALAARVEDLTTRGAAAAAAEQASLRRLERDLHDGPQQRLVRLGMDLASAERRLEQDPAAARELIDAARTQATETLGELRALSRGIAPPVLADRGLVAAVSAVAGRCTVPVSVADDVPADRPAPAVESAAYFVVSEALVNVAKHSQATAARVAVRRTVAAHGARLVVEVEDDGVGGASTAKGHGLAGLVDRVEGLGGSLTISSPSGGPTVLRADLPWRA